MRPALELETGNPAVDARCPPPPPTSNCTCVACDCLCNQRSMAHVCWVHRTAKIIAVDLQEMAPIPGVHIIKGTAESHT